MEGLCFLEEPIKPCSIETLVTQLLESTAFVQFGVQSELGSLDEALVEKDYEAVEKDAGINVK